MCLGSATPKPVIVDPANRSANAAADALVARRQNAQGFAASLGSGMPATPPSIGRQLLLGGN